MAAELNIVVVEDHDVLRDELVDYLSRPGWSVRGVDCGEELDRALRTHAADIVVLDLSLPFEDGLSIARRLRAAMPEIGLIMLTGRVRPSERADGYATGADVYLTKPTSVHELEAVIENLSKRLRRAPPSDHVLDVRRMRLLAPSGAAVELTLTETEILSRLATAPERQLDTDFLLSRLTHNDTLGKHREALTVAISRMRGKIQRHLGEADFVRAVRGFGYRLNVPVRLED